MSFYLYKSSSSKPVFKVHLSFKIICILHFLCISFKCIQISVHWLLINKLGSIVLLLAPGHKLCTQTFLKITYRKKSLGPIEEKGVDIIGVGNIEVMEKTLCTVYLNAAKRFISFDINPLHSLNCSTVVAAAAERLAFK